MMQFQADILGHPRRAARACETTALGAAYAAGLATGLWAVSTSCAPLAEVQALGADDG